MKKLLLAFMVAIGFAGQATACVHEMMTYFLNNVIYAHAWQGYKQELQLMYKQKQLQQMDEQGWQPMGRKMRRDFSYKRVLQGYERKLQREESRRTILAPILPRNRE